jgi:tRNA (cytidine/uridine-2'-O-)-methyltransferase
MFHVVLYQPEIPPNTGNVIRLCANAGAALHLIRPLGFELDDARLRRAGLDYREYAQVRVHDALETFVSEAKPGRLLACSTYGTTRHDDVRYEEGDALIFGPETRGLPKALLTSLPATQRLRIPMVPDSRSLNLSNAVAIVLYEAWRQHGFRGGV